MHFFSYRKGELYAEDVPLRVLAKKYGTPLYVYSQGTLERHVESYEKAFGGFPHVLCFAVKANSNLAVLGILARKGAGADVVSGGELFRALKAGVPASKIVYAGVGKTEEEIRYALKSGIMMFNIESGQELREIDRVAGRLRAKAPIALRINPDIDPLTHPYISTGLKKYKFGIPMEEALEYFRLAQGMKNVEVVGIHKHIGSQITEVTPFVDAMNRILTLVDELRDGGLAIRYLDMGGGLGIPYNHEPAAPPSELARRVLPLLDGRDLTLVLEPGRSISGNAGVLLSKVLYLKKGPGKEFVIVDAGMNDLMRPTLYDAYHEILPVRKRRTKKIVADVVGPICESGDFLARERPLQRLERGDLIAVMSSGAYGFTMSSNYNSRPRAAEVMVKGRRHFLVRERETYGDLVRKEKKL
ncbi:MAG: diaminopimelate decarboxylase [Nitrospirota bacterium]|jgi:diaminopimelate decarboxylase